MECAGPCGSPARSVKLARIHNVAQRFAVDVEVTDGAISDAAAIAGGDRESHQRDLYEAIERGDFPKWKMFVQIMPEAEAETYRFHPFDLTKVWYKADYPLIEVGEFELNRNPENFFAEIEQSAFNPSNLVPGIAPSADKMLQGRLFSYHDTHLHRLGTLSDTGGRVDGVKVMLAGEGAYAVHVLRQIATGQQAPIQRQASTRCVSCRLSVISFYPRGQEYSYGLDV